jgi:hypothetical protein
LNTRGILGAGCGEFPVERFGRETVSCGGEKLKVESSKFKVKTFRS